MRAEAIRDPETGTLISAAHTITIDITRAPSVYLQVYRWDCTCGRKGRWSGSARCARRGGINHVQIALRGPRAEKAA